MSYKYVLCNIIFPVSTFLIFNVFNIRNVGFGLLERFFWFNGCSMSTMFDSVLLEKDFLIWYFFIHNGFQWDYRRISLVWYIFNVSHIGFETKKDFLFITQRTLCIGRILAESVLLNVCWTKINTPRCFLLFGNDVKCNVDNKRMLVCCSILHKYNWSWNRKIFIVLDLWE